MFKHCKGFLFLVAGLALFTAPYARAGTWHGPVYVVSERNRAANGTDVGVPAGGGGSTVQGRIRAQGPLASGTVTARFIWLPDPKLAPDPPPTTLTIAETGSASWREFYGTSKTPRSTGVADNGLGHSAFIGDGGHSGSSSGTLLRTYRVINDAVTTKPVTLKAMASSASNTYWRYCACVSPYEIKVTCNGKNISQSEGSVFVLARTPFHFVATVVSHGLPVKEPQWTLDTSRFNSDTGEERHPLTNSDLHHFSLDAYYIGFVPQAAALPIYRCGFSCSNFCQAVKEDVMFTVNINGKPYSVRGKVCPYNRRA